MSRSGYSDDLENWSLIRWRGAVNSALTGARGQSFLRELADAMDAMPEKKLVADKLVDEEGCFCTLGVIGASRGIDMTNMDPHDAESVAGAFGIATAMAQEIVYENDECWTKETPEDRWLRMRNWVQHHLDRVQKREAA